MSDDIDWHPLVSAPRARRESRRLALGAATVWAAPAAILILASGASVQSSLVILAVGTVLGGGDIRRRLREFEAWTQIEWSAFGMRVRRGAQYSVTAWEEVRGVSLDAKGLLILDLDSSNGCVLLTRKGVDERAWETIVGALSANWPCVRERDQFGPVAA